MSRHPIYYSSPSIHPMTLQPISGIGLLFLRFRNSDFLWCGVVSPTPNPQPGAPDLRIYDPGDRVAQLHPRTPGSSGTSGVPLPYPLLWAPEGTILVIRLLFSGTVLGRILSCFTVIRMLSFQLFFKPVLSKLRPCAGCWLEQSQFTQLISLLFM
jgi:hypothetical protein